MGAQRAFGHHHVTRTPAEKRVTVWLAMRQLVRFDVSTLVMTTEVAKRTVVDYLYALGNAGYLRNQRVATGAGIHGAKFMWHLVRDTGPKAPIWRKKHDQVYDPNNGKCYAPGGAEVACKGESDADAA
jgi:uncharacterized membrane protein